MLLIDRFKLNVHQEKKASHLCAGCRKERRNAPGGVKPSDIHPNGIKGPEGRSGAGMMFDGREGLTAQGIPIANPVGHLSLQLRRMVIDKTGLAGKYDFTLEWRR